MIVLLNKMVENSCTSLRIYWKPSFPIRYLFHSLRDGLTIDMTSFLALCRKTRIYRPGKSKQATDRSVVGKVQIHKPQHYTLYQIIDIFVKKIPKISQNCSKELEHCQMGSFVIFYDLSPMLRKGNLILKRLLFSVAGEPKKSRLRSISCEKSHRYYMQLSSC